MPEKLTCPILSIIDGYAWCCKEQCAWWNSNKEECAVPTLAMAFNGGYLMVERVPSNKGSCYSRRPEGD